MAEERYTLIEHTADLAFLAYGRDIGELFANAAFALFDTYTDISKVEEKIKRSVHIKIETEGAETDYEQLLVKWLNELLYLNETEDLLFKSFRVESIVDGELKALACGERFSPERHVILTPFKAVTYHRIEIAREPDRWHARVIVDI